MHTTTQATTDHGQAVTAIDDALESLQDAILAEKAARANSPDDLPKLKFPIQLSSNKHKPFQFVTDWRRWAAVAGWKVRGA